MTPHRVRSVVWKLQITQSEVFRDEPFWWAMIGITSMSYGTKSLLLTEMDVGMGEGRENILSHFPFLLKYN